MSGLNGCMGDSRGLVGIRNPGWNAVFLSFVSLSASSLSVFTPRGLIYNPIVLTLQSGSGLHKLKRKPCQIPSHLIFQNTLVNLL